MCSKIIDLKCFVLHRIKNIMRHILQVCVLAAQWLARWTLTRAIRVRTLAKANHIVICYALNNIKFISDESSTELVLSVCVNK